MKVYLNPQNLTLPMRRACLRRISPRSALLGVALWRLYAALVVVLVVLVVVASAVK